MDVALALVLNEIVHQARSITNAAGAAVLLMREEFRSVDRLPVLPPEKHPLT